MILAWCSPLNEGLDRAACGAGTRHRLEDRAVACDVGVGGAWRFLRIFAG